jgi:hypothetical protein
MTREEIVQLAEKAGASASAHSFIVGWADIERFAHLVAKAEREACAKAAEGYADFQLQLGDDLAQWRAIGALAVMAAISERGQE